MAKRDRGPLTTAEVIEIAGGPSWARPLRSQVDWAWVAFAAGCAAVLGGLLSLWHFTTAGSGVRPPIPDAPPSGLHRWLTDGPSPSWQVLGATLATVIVVEVATLLAWSVQGAPRRIDLTDGSARARGTARPVSPDRARR